VLGAAPIEHDIRALLRTSAVDTVTTMLDLYGLPSDTPGLSDAPAGDPYARVGHVAEAMARVIDDPRFLPFLVLHETEAWVLAAANELAELIESPRLADVLRSQSTAAGGPELVNDGPDSVAVEADPEGPPRLPQGRGRPGRDRAARPG
jgi:hypothetical protein